jgi:hypothetical protein
MGDYFMKHSDLTRTRDALRAYDALRTCKTGTIPPQAEAEEEEWRLVGAVAEAFAEDTADRNDKETILQVIRPGPAHPGPGMDLTFVRKCVRWWETNREPVAVRQMKPDMIVYFRPVGDHYGSWTRAIIDRVEFPKPQILFKVFLRDRVEAVDFYEFEWERDETRFD